MKKLLSLMTLLLAALVLTACGNDSGGASDASAESEFNQDDVQFAQSMIPHHRQAVEMAQLAADRAQSSEVKQLAADIEAAQGPEIEQLTTWLEQWGEDVPAASEGGMEGMEGMESEDMGGMDMGGMMTAEDMEMLSNASGAEFDQMFLEMMVEHHNGAVEMAKTEIAEGQHSGAVAMAEEIVATQEAEIEKMEQLLAS